MMSSNHKKALALIIICLFGFVSSSVRAERAYVSRLSDQDIFINQLNTGPYALDNCGPTALAMIFNYLNYDYDTVNELRRQIRPYSGWVYTNEIEDYLNTHALAYKMRYVDSSEDLINLINDKQIILLCVNISYVRYNAANKLIGRTYTGGTGHFLVVSGYYQDDSRLYFEVLDPLNRQVRYYESEELVSAINNWWTQCFAFKKIN